MARRRRLAASITIIGCLSAAVSVALRAQNPAPQPQTPPTFRAGVNVVRVDAVVTDKTGAPVLDLTAADFEITEAGKRQQIDTFKFVSQSGSLAGADSISSRNGAFAEDDAARDEVRLFAIFLDDYHVSASMRQVVGSQVARFVEDELAPGDLVGVMRPTDLLSELEFTRDHERVANQIRRFGEKTAEGKYPVDHRFDNVNPAVARSIKLDVSFDAMQALIMRLGSLKEGRKALMIVSDNYPGDRGGRGGGGDGAAFAALRSKIGKTTELANRHNTALYPVSPRLRQAPRAVATPSEIPLLLADGSGGRAIFDYTKDFDKVRENRTRAVPHTTLAGAMKQVVTDMTGYYLLGYQSSLGPPDGKYHKIDLKVKRRNLDVRYRRGYWAATSAQLEPRIITSGSEDGDVMAAVAALTTPRLFPIRSWTGMERGDGGKTRIRFSWDPTLAPPLEVAPVEERPARVTLEASQPGADVTYFSGDVRSSVVFDAPPGPVQIRVVVENQAADVLDRFTRTITATDFGEPALTLGTPQVFRTRSQVEWQRVQSGSEGTPVATRDFSRVDRLLIRVPTYAPADTAVTLRATLVNRTGQPMRDLSVTSGSGGPSVIDLPLANLAVEAYAVRITASAAGRDVEELLAFRVTR